MDAISCLALYAPNPFRGKILNKHDVFLRKEKERPMTDEMPAIMTIEQVAKYLSLHPLTVRRLARDGELPAFKVGRQWRVKKDPLDQWIAEQSEMNIDAVSTAVK